MVEAPAPEPAAEPQRVISSPGPESANVGRVISSGRPDTTTTADATRRAAAGSPPAGCSADTARRSAASRPVGKPIPPPPGRPSVGVGQADPAAARFGAPRRRTRRWWRWTSRPRWSQRRLRRSTRWRWPRWWAARSVAAPVADPVAAPADPVEVARVANVAHLAAASVVVVAIATSCSPRSRATRPPTRPCPRARSSSSVACRPRSSAPS